MLARIATALPLRTSVVLVLIVSAAAFDTFFFRAQLHDDSRMADERQLSVLAKQVRRVREFVEHDGVDSAQLDMIRQFRSVTEDPSLRAALLVSSSGIVLAANPPELAGMSAADALHKAGEPPDLAAEIEQTRKPGGSHSRVEGTRAIVFSPVDHTEDRPVLLAIRSLDAVHKRVRDEVVGETATIGLVLLALVAALWLWLEIALNRRIRRLVDAAARIASDDLEARARLGGSDELAMAGRAFDEMADAVASTRARLRESEERVRLLLESTGEGICGLDLSGRVTFCNPAGLKLLRVGSAQILGQPLYDMLRLPGSEQTLERAWIELALKTCARVEQELAVPCEDGSVVPLHHSGSPVLLDGRLVGRVVTLTDLTARKRAEEELRRSQAQLRMADRLATVGTLSAGVAHEINNPLAYTIANLGYVAERLRDLPGSLDLDEVDTAIAEALEGAERVRRIVKDMKTLSRVDDETISAVDVERALDASVNMALHELRQKANVVKEYAGVGFALANEGRLVQVFLNLLVNASQAIATSSPESNEVRIVTCLDAEGRIAVEISDTGGGIPEDVLPRIFDPFFTTKPLGVGTGLGLSICHSLVTAIGGEIDVTSKVGTGTRFLLTLPSVQPGAAALRVRPAA
ncbi:MAG TPA: ATP-binding protein [Myxococcales bacterium]|nr:ATP-binding protein [Myxococcales bacterium]